MRRSSSADLDSFLENEAFVKENYPETPKSTSNQMEEYTSVFPKQEKSERIKNSVIHMISRKSKITPKRYE
jgi:hypothetical protein